MLAGNSGSKSNKKNLIFGANRSACDNYILKSINTKTKVCCTDKKVRYGYEIVVTKKLNQGRGRRRSKKLV